MTTTKQVDPYRPAFSATKQVGYVLQAASALNWKEATDVLNDLFDVEDAAMNDALRQLLEGETSPFRNAAGKPLVSSSTLANRRRLDRLGDRGHIYKSELFKSTFGDLVVYHRIAFTVCVRLPSPYDSALSKEIKSKFWYSADIENSVHGESIDLDLLHRCTSEVEKLAPIICKTATSIYSQSIDKLTKNPSNVSICDDISIDDLCLQFDDANFGSDLQHALKGDWAAVQKSNNPAMVALREINRRDYFSASFKCVDSTKKEIYVQSDQYMAEALYLTATLKTNRSGSFNQRALGVTSSRQPIGIPNSKGVSLSEFDHVSHRAAHSLSNKRVTVIAANF